MNIVLGVTGGIAAYKACELVRLLTQRGCEVRVVMTREAVKFVGSLTFEALSGHPVLIEGQDSPEAAMAHITWARFADCILIAPATAHCIAQLALGLASDWITSLVLATDAPLIIAPAMNQQMYQQVTTQTHLRTLEARGVQIIGPASGIQACGEMGPGRMVEPSDIVATLLPLQSQVFIGKTIVITAGPTQEPLDPIRFLSNHSSGKMGYALAQEALRLGARVILISGPTQLTPPAGTELIAVTTALEMYEAVEQVVDKADIFIATAAVADYRPELTFAQKIKKTEDKLTLTLVKNPDILSMVAKKPLRPFCVGFAAETEKGAQFARQKLVAKSVDVIALNEVNQPGIGFHSDENALTVYWQEGTLTLAKASKAMIAKGLLDCIGRLYHAKSKT